MRQARLVTSHGGEHAFIIETDYPDLATFERDTAQFYSDAEMMSIWRKAGALTIEGSGRDELPAGSPELA